MTDPAAGCVFFGPHVSAAVWLSDVVPCAGAGHFLCSDLAAAVLQDVVADCERDAAPPPSCLHALALEVERAADRREWWPATLGASVPIAWRASGGDVREPAAADFLGSEALAKLVPALRRRLGEQGGSSEFRRLCPCETCAKLRQPDGWAAMLGGLAGFSRMPSWHDDLPAKERPPVPLQEVSMPLAEFVATLDPDQRVISPDGSVLPAGEFAVRKREPVLDARGKPRFKRNGDPVERWAVSGLAYLRNGAETPYPGVGPLAEAALPVSDPFRAHDFQRCRYEAIEAGRLDPASETCPCGIGSRLASVEPERCILCGAIGPYPPDAHGKARPLVVLCDECGADLDDAISMPGGWRYLTQPGHGLESLVGLPFFSEVLLPSGEIVFSLTEVRPGYVPVVLSILQADLLVSDRSGKIRTVADWRADILGARKP